MTSQLEAPADLRGEDLRRWFQRYRADSRMAQQAEAVSITFEQEKSLILLIKPLLGKKAVVARPHVMGIPIIVR